MTAAIAAAAPRQRPRHWARALSPLAEALLLLLVIAALWPGFARVAEFGDGREQRFAARGVPVAGLPDPVLPEACAALGSAADAALRERLCSGPRLPWPARTDDTTAFPPALGQAASHAARALAAPVTEAQAQVLALRQRLNEGLGDLRAQADTIATIEAELAPYLERFQLGPGEQAGPLPMRCALQSVQAAFAADEHAAPAALRANAALLLAAALDGRDVASALATQAVLPATGTGSASCRAGTASALAATAALMADARQSMAQARKNEAMRALMRSAGWQWAAAMLGTYGLLLWSRRAASPLPGLAAAFAGWAAAAWAARVPWPLAGARSFEPARAEAAWTGAPAGFVLALLAAAALLGIAAAARQPATAEAGRPQAMSSRLGFAGLALATGLGWLLLLDLSAHGHPVNRYLALYHQGHLWLGLVVLSALLFLRRPLGRAVARGLSALGARVGRLAAGLTPAPAALLVALGALGAVLVFGTLLANLRQLTSELGRLWLIIGAAWFFFLRAGPLTRRLAERGAAHVPIWRYAWPLLLVVGVLIAAMVVTRDMGPLLIAGYASGAFIGAAVAMWWHARGGSAAASFALALLLFVAWIGAVSAALFQAGEVDAVTAARLESLAAPLASTNDQLALVTWFQRAAPPQGHGLGAVPWCGHAAAAGCSGVPAQVHSDYTFTAIVGVFGAAAAWAAALGCAFWLHRLVRHHGRVTRGEPRLIAAGARLVHDGQALVSWIAVSWVVLTMCQLAVTVAGNLAVLPLTGVTFPFVSYGMTSLLVNLACLALCLSVDVPERAA
jgi:cell division protein FtsW (lipid II flippase)